MKIKTRLATTKDIKEIQNMSRGLFDFEKENFNSKLDPAWCLGEEAMYYFVNIINNHYLSLAIIDDKIVGYIACEIRKKYSGETIFYAEIDNIFIYEKYRKYGAGTKLFNEFLEYCKEKGIETIKVNSLANNPKAIKFYESRGFKPETILWKIEI